MTIPGWYYNKAIYLKSIYRSSVFSMLFSLSLKTSSMFQMFGELPLDKNLKRDYDDHVWQTLTVNIIRSICFVVFNCVNKIPEPVCILKKTSNFQLSKK